MDEEHKRQVAIFRFGVISDFVSPARLEWGERERLLQEKCAREWQIPFSGRTRLSRTTILSWVRAYERGGRRLEAIYPRDRSDQGTPRALDEETALALIGLRRQAPRATVKSLIRQAKERRLVDPEQHLAGSTVWRLFKREGLMRPQAEDPVDRRRYEAELPNDIWQSDAMHGPWVRAEGRKRKTYLFAFLDDMSRLITHAQFYLSEKLDSYLDALRQALLSRGLPRKLYVDNGPAFRSQHLNQICASLGIALVHSKPYQPQGRGKIERWFRTVRSDFLPGFRGESLEELNEALDAWIRNLYHNREHRSTGETPLRRFASHSECLRSAPKDLEDHFRKQARRRVAKDRTVALDGCLYEAPTVLIGKQLTLLYHEHDPSRIEAFYEGRSFGMLRSVDLNVNCRVHRQQGNLKILTEPRPLSGGKLPFTARKEGES
ncbi:MAG: DDE-type integrase/transposase/recombinase [Deltaproteobacteria bacterium]|nr:DDE-type integrase/transposase/recombinase [Deltaproteobacteria bacterium]